MHKRILRKISWEKILYLFFFIFSAYIMLHTFGYDSQHHEMQMASRVWSDFGAHIPLIRSFSLGHNWPPEYPIYPGEKIRYHFLFYFIVGMIERLGVRIDWALNMPSIIGFFLLLVGIYKVATLLFERKRVGVLAVIFFLFNGSFSFLKFFEKHPLGPSTLHDIFTLNQFSTFGPWDGNLVTAFVHLNVYTNQRHLGLSFAIVLFILYALFKIKEVTRSTHTNRFKKIISTTITQLKPTKQSLMTGVGIGFLAGSLFFLNHPALLITVIFCGYLFLFHGKTRIPLFVTLVITIPFLYYFFQIAAPGGTPTWLPGYLSSKPLNWPSFIIFWFFNLGLHSILIPVGFLIAPRKIRFLFIPILVLFIVPNIYQFSIDMINNHKFFNFFMIIGNMYTAYVLVKAWDIKIIFIRFITIIIFIFLTFSGFLDLMPIIHDYTIVLNDIPANKDAAFIARNTPPDAIILNSTWFYHPASIAGRKIYNGYSFFTWSAGYDAYGREAIVKEIYRSEDKEDICTKLKQANISYVELNDKPESFLEPVSMLWKQMSPSLYYNPDTGVRLFKMSDICEPSL